MTTWNINQNDRTLSVFAVSRVVMLLSVNLGILTIFTHASQVVGLTFQRYAVVSLLLILVISSIFVWRNAGEFKNLETRDWIVLFSIILIAALGIFVSLSMRRVGRFIPDEYYYGANPVHYIQHPEEKMGFEMFFFYSGGEPFYSVAYLTATAFDYFLGVIAYFTNISFIQTYYVIGGGLGGLLIPLSIFLALSRFSRDTIGAALGTFFTVISILLLAETVWTPGGYSFPRAFEGKIIMLFAGIPLFIYLSLQYLSAAQNTAKDLPRLLPLFFLLTMLTGMSTSSFMIFPILAAILFASYWLTFRENFPAFRDVALRGVMYLSSFLYLILFAVFVSQRDKLDTALAINISNGYTDSVNEYLLGFYNPALPITPVILGIYSLAIPIILREKRRLFVLLWMLFAALIAPNPIVASLLLNFFRGIYFRLMYVYPFPLMIGIVFSALYEESEEDSRTKLWPLTIAMFASLLLLLPSSIFVSDRYQLGSWRTYKENAAALEIVSLAPPHGIMIAPYPISGAISMMDSEYAQLITRDDHTDIYLNLQGRGEEAKLRMQTSDFLDDGRQEDYPAFTRLLEMYPSTKTIIFNKKLFYRKYYADIAHQLTQLMQQSGFTRRQDLESSVIFWKP